MPSNTAYIPASSHSLAAVPDINLRRFGTVDIEGLVERFDGDHRGRGRRQFWLELQQPRNEGHGPNGVADSRVSSVSSASTAPLSCKTLVHGEILMG